MKTFQEYLDDVGTGNIGGGAESPGTQSDDITGVNMPLFGAKKKSKLIRRKVPTIQYQKGEDFPGAGKYIQVPEEVEK